MTLSRLRYRFWQFWHALRAAPTSQDLAEVRKILTAGQMALFTQMQPGEQAHSLRVFRRLKAAGFQNPAACDPNLLVAALLHDAGKVRAPLRLWERVLIVLARAASPGQVTHWGADKSGEALRRPWQRPFIVAVQHPAWGADLAGQAGCSDLAVALIRRHQDSLLPVRATLEDRMLEILQTADGEN